MRCARSTVHGNPLRKIAPDASLDNLTHTLCGAALAATSLRRRSPLSAPALLVAANLPDIDTAAELWGGRPAYLIHHRGLTHSVVGLAAQALLFSLLVGWIERRSARRAVRCEPRRLASLPAIGAGLASHLLLDWLNTRVAARPMEPGALDAARRDGRGHLQRGHPSPGWHPGDGDPSAPPSRSDRGTGRARAGGARVDLLDGRYRLAPGAAWCTLTVDLIAAALAGLPQQR